MTDDADAIAAGDLTRRVRPVRRSSEIGRLGRALNGMLAQIEDGVRRAHHVGGAPAELPGRRLPRAPHAAHLDPGLRRAAAQGCAGRRRRPGSGPWPASRARRSGWGCWSATSLMLARQGDGPSPRTGAGGPGGGGDRCGRRRPGATTRAGRSTLASPRSPVAGDRQPARAG